MSRFALVAKLVTGAETQAADLIAAGPPFDPAAVGLVRHTVYLAYDEVVFVFEGPEAESIVSDVVDDPFRSPVFSAWRELVDQPPRIAREAYFWAREPTVG